MDCSIDFISRNAVLQVRSVILGFMLACGFLFVGPSEVLSQEYPPINGLIGNENNWPSPPAAVELFAIWDACGALITPGDALSTTVSCIDAVIASGRDYFTYHLLLTVEPGPTTGIDDILATYPNLEPDGLWIDYDEQPHYSEDEGIPKFNNQSDVWLDFIIDMIKMQVDYGATGIGFDSGWGSLGIGVTPDITDFSDLSMEKFRQYLAARYPDAADLAARGISDISSFNMREEVQNTEVIVDDISPSSTDNPFTSDWWVEEIEREIEPGETYTQETLWITVENMSVLPSGPTFTAHNNLLNLLNPVSGDYSYFNSLRLREIYTTLQDEIKPYAAAQGQPWHLSANIYNYLDWNNVAVAATVLDFPMGELPNGQFKWPAKNFTSFYKNMAALGKKFSSMFHPGQELAPMDDTDTEALLMFLADAHASGGISQHPGSVYDDLVNPFYELIQSHDNFFMETDNRVALYYSLGNHMGDVGRVGSEVETYYGAARLLEDSHISYDVLYQGDPELDSAPIQWIDQEVSLSDMQDYDVIVLPSVFFMLDSEVQNFLDFVNNGGILVVFGEAGIQDFEQAERENTAWDDLTTTGTVFSYGSGYSIIFPNDYNGNFNLAQYYDYEMEAEDEFLLGDIRDDFQDELFSVYTNDIITDYSRDVHIHKFHDPSEPLEAFHLVNFDYDLSTDDVNPTFNNDFTFVPSGNYVIPQVTYYTPDSPGGVDLPITELPGDYLQVTIPELHVYGIVVIRDALECVRANEIYKAETLDLAQINLNGVVIHAAVDDDGQPIPSHIVDCNYDGVLDVLVWGGTFSGSTPQHAVIRFDQEICNGSAPETVIITATLGTPVLLEGFDDSGNLVDTATAPDLGNTVIQTLTLSSSSGIRNIRVTGAEFCIQEICWVCSGSQERDVSPSPPPKDETQPPKATSTPAVSPTPDPDINGNLPEGVVCLTADEVYAEPITGLSMVDLNALRIQEALLPGGSSAPLNVIDCNGDDRLDVQIPWSQSNAVRKAMIEFDPPAGNGVAPQVVDITLTYGTPIRLEAFDDNGTSVDVVSDPGSNPDTVQPLTLSSIDGIHEIKIEGAEICIVKICWSYDALSRFQQSMHACISAGGIYNVAQSGLSDVNFQAIQFSEAIRPDGAGATLDISDCDADGDLDVFIPWTLNSANRLAAMEFDRHTCTGHAPQAVEITFTAENMNVRSYDENGSMVATASGQSDGPTANQRLTLSSPSGIRLMEFEGAEICIVEVCWWCEGQTD